MKWLKRIGYVLGTLAVIAGATYGWLLVESHRASPESFPIDMSEIRHLADVQAGEKPQSIHVETVAHLSVPDAMVVAGGDWRHVDLAVASFELVYRDHSVVVDTALDAAIARSMGASEFDRAAYARMSRALARASLIVVTHEHPDHIGGLLAQPELNKLLPDTALTTQQVDVLKANLDSDGFADLHIRPGVFDGYRPLAYARYHALAPGVVLIKAPGHTPGSQMIYVRRADGVEYLFVGDVAWLMRNIRSQREKSRLASLMAGEDRTQVREELAALHRLHATDPALHMMPGHDAAVIDAWVKQGLLVRGF